MNPPRNRAVLLGASNLTLGFGRALAQVRARAPEPVEILAAHGPGRSYGLRTRVLGRGLPGHLEHGLWDKLREEPLAERPTRALVTDIGNDILYEVPTGTLLEWIEVCLDRLAAVNARTTLTLLPLESIRSLGSLRFKLMRTVLFPRRRSSLPEIIERSEELQTGLEAFGKRPEIELALPESSWFGFDPIHVRRAHRASLWERYLGTPGERARPSPRRSSPLEAWRAPLWRPRSWSLLEIELSSPQPAHRWRDGSDLWLY